MPSSLSSRRVKAENIDEGVETFHRNGWTDGLPVILPTEEKVEEFLSAAGLSAEDVLGVEPTKGMVATAEKVAINTVMAGCLPMHMPVVAAATRAMCQDRFNLHAISVSTMGAAVLTLVSGPAVGELGMNTGVSLYGPGNRANSAIGRAVRLILMNVMGARPGVLDQATQGHPGKHTWCFAENTDASPWQPFHVDRGMDDGQSAVTVFAALSPIQVGEHASDKPEGVLDAFIDPLFAMQPGMKEALFVFCPEHARTFREAGWDRRDVAEYLYHAASRPASEWAARRRPAADRSGDEPVSALDSPASAVIAVGGGMGGAWSSVIPMWSAGAKTLSVTEPVS